MLEKIKWNSIFVKKYIKLKIATLNIDWFKKSKDLQKTIKEEIKKQDLDFLIVNENIESFHFDENYEVKHSKSIPTDKEFQHLNYGVYLKGETPIRTSIYSKHKAIKQLKTSDSYTSVCSVYSFENQEIAIYGTIIGTWGIKYQKEIASVELDNFKIDIQNLLKENENIFIVGDFNTSFFENEKRYLSALNSREELLNFTNKLNIHRITENIENCIDHIFVSNNLKQISNFKTATFLDNDILKDNPHKGILLNVVF